MKKIIKQHLVWVFFSGMFLFSLQANAVYEGRSEQLRENAGIRNQVEISSFGENRAGSNLDPNSGDSRRPDNSVNRAPLSDLPLVFLLLSGAAYIGYVSKKRNAKTAIK